MVSATSGCDFGGKRFPTLRTRDVHGRFREDGKGSRERLFYFVGGRYPSTTKILVILPWETGKV